MNLALKDLLDWEQQIESKIEEIFDNTDIQYSIFDQIDRPPEGKQGGAGEDYTLVKFAQDNLIRNSVFIFMLYEAMQVKQKQNQTHYKASHTFDIYIFSKQFKGERGVRDLAIQIADELRSFSDLHHIMANPMPEKDSDLFMSIISIGYPDSF
jgi:hypothetical protein